MSSSIAHSRLTEERRNLRRDHPPGFWAKPVQNADGTLDKMKWEACVPGKGTPFADRELKLVLHFTEDYPSRPPKCQFKPVLFHPNVFPSGTVCLSILNEEKDWKPCITIKQILLGIQELLGNPNANDPAQSEPFKLFVEDKARYEERVKQNPFSDQQPR